MQFLWKYIDDLVGKGLDWTIIMELLLYATAGLVSMALPLAILLASIMTFGNLGEHYELTAIKSSGISLFKIMRPLLFLNLFISIGAFFFSNYVLPYTNLKTGSLLFDVSHQRPELNIKEGIFNNDIDNYTIRILKKNKKTSMMYGFMLYDHTKGKHNQSVTVADSARMNVTSDDRFMILTLYNGYAYDEIKEKKRGSNREFPLRRDRFAEKQVTLNLEDFAFQRSSDQLFKHNYQMLNLNQLDKAIDSLSNVANKKQHNFAYNLLAVKYMKYTPKQGIKDSLNDKKFDIPIAKIPVAKDIDSIYNQYTNKKKQRILSMALNNARSTHSGISREKNRNFGNRRTIRKHFIAWHRKFTLSFACFIFFFIGAPLGAIIRKGGFGISVVISILFFVIYYIISLIGEKAVREDLTPILNGMWSASLVLLPIGAFLTYKAVTDSVLLNFDAYIDFFRKIPFIKKLFSKNRKTPYIVKRSYVMMVKKFRNLQGKK